MLDSTIKAQLQAYLERMTRPLELLVSLDDRPSSQEMKELVVDIVEASQGRINARNVDFLQRKPSFAIAAPGQTPRIVFSGLPMGHEFTSLVLALLQSAGYPPKVEPEILEQAKGLEGKMDFEVFMSLSCHNCPDVVQALNLLAAVNPNVTSTVIDGGLFQEEVTAKEIMAVPAVHLNGKPFASGRMTLEEILAKLDTSATEKEAKKLSQKAVFDVLVVGGGPAGIAAAVYAARKGISTGVLAERLGGQTNDTLGIENYISVLETTGPRFSGDLAAHAKHYGVDLMERQRVAAIARKPDGLIEVKTESGAVLKARSVILATGARWRNLNVPGEEEFKNKGVAYCPHCDGPLFKGKDVAVVGGGNSGVEAAIDLAGVVKHVTLLEFGGQLKADAVLVDKLKSLPNTTVLTNAQTLEVQGQAGKVSGLKYRDRQTQEEKTVELEGVFVQIGLVPNTEFLRGSLELTNYGEIVVDARGATSIPGVFAAGDATTVPFKQIVIAAGEGAKAALSAFDYLIRGGSAH